MTEDDDRRTSAMTPTHSSEETYSKWFSRNWNRSSVTATAKKKSASNCSVGQHEQQQQRTAAITVHVYDEESRIGGWMDRWMEYGTTILAGFHCFSKWMRMEKKTTSSYFAPLYIHPLEIVAFEGSHRRGYSMVVRWWILRLSTVVQKCESSRRFNKIPVEDYVTFL